MTIRRVNKGDKTLTSAIKGKKANRISTLAGENFSQHMDSIAALQGTTSTVEVSALSELTAVDMNPSQHQKRERILQTGELLDSLTELEQEMAKTALKEKDLAQHRRRLRESRDQALRTLSELPKIGDEHDLLHRTAVLATVELAKTDRGDYN
ncbi:MAG: hypothetical protein H7832_03555 [Magnetococcus sp. DMHC-6]